MPPATIRHFPDDCTLTTTASRVDGFTAICRFVQRILGASGACRMASELPDRANGIALPPGSPPRAPEPRRRSGQEAQGRADEPEPTAGQQAHAYHPEPVQHRQASGQQGEDSPVSICTTVQSEIGVSEVGGRNSRLAQAIFKPADFPAVIVIAATYRTTARLTEQRMNAGKPARACFCPRYPPTQA